MLGGIYLVFVSNQPIVYIECRNLFSHILVDSMNYQIGENNLPSNADDSTQGSGLRLCLLLGAHSAVD